MRRSHPYCGNCDYDLTGLTDSSKCPECGRPLVDVLTRDQFGPGGRRYRSPVVLFGLPLVDVAFGPDGGEPRGHAHGIIALGDTAVGWLALGGAAGGIFACGGVSAGVVAVGGCAGGLIAFGGVGLGGLAFGGAALGGVATGSAALGWVAQGAAAVGHFARSLGGQAGGQSSASAAFFTEWSWLFGGTLAELYWIALWAVVVALLLALGCAAALALAWRQRQESPPPWKSC